MRAQRWIGLLAWLGFALAIGCGKSGASNNDAGTDAGASDAGDAGRADAGDGGNGTDAGDAGGVADGGGPADAGDGGVPAHFLVLFGGYYTDQPPDQSDPPTDYLGETWTWNGAAWSQQSDAGPGTRNLSTIGIAAEKVVMFGGEGGDADNNRTTLGDSWLWNGSMWTQNLATNAPEEMAGAIATSCNGKFVLFGGYDFTGSNRYDTWTWDGAGWTEFPSPQGLSPPISGPRSSLGTVAASVDGTCYLIDYDSTMYSWNGSAWLVVDQGATIPPARFYAAAAGLAGKMVLFGGSSTTDGGASLADTWVWDGVAWTQATSPGPGGRTAAMMASYGDTVVLFGGELPSDAGEDGVPTFLGDTWTWDGGSWAQVASTGPSPRALSVMVGR